MVIEGAVARATQELCVLASGTSRPQDRQEPLSLRRTTDAEQSRRAGAKWAVALAMRGAAARLQRDSMLRSNPPKLYGAASRRWRLAVRRVMCTRIAASACCLRGDARFSVDRVVGAIEASLAIDEEFHALMTRWDKRRKTVNTCHARIAPGSPKQPEDHLELAFERKISREGGAHPTMPPAVARTVVTGRRSILDALPPPKFQDFTARPTMEDVRKSVGHVLRAVAVRLEARDARKSIAVETAPRDASDCVALAVRTARASLAEARPLALFERRQVVAFVVRGAIRRAADCAHRDALLASEDILASKRRIAAAEARAEMRVSLASTKIQAAVRGRQARHSTWNGSVVRQHRLETSASKAEEEAVAAAEEIQSTRQRMQAALLQTEAKVAHATTRIQAAARGNQARKDLQELRRKSAPGHSEEVAMCQKRRSWADIFDEAARSKVGEPLPRKGCLDKVGFASALHEVHPHLCPAQVEALWQGFSRGMGADSVDLQSFCDVAEAVAAGSHAAAEFADLPMEAYEALARGAPGANEAQQPAPAPASVQRQSLSSFLGWE